MKDKFTAAAEKMNKVMAIALTLCIIMTAFVITAAVLDRLYSTETLTSAIADIENDSLRNFVSGSFEANHEVVNNIGTTLRQLCWWNSNNPDSYAEETYIVLTQRGE